MDLRADGEGSNNSKEQPAEDPEPAQQVAPQLTRASAEKESLIAMVQRANSGPDDASIMRCAVARRCIQLGYHKTADGMVHINAVELGPLGNDASFRCVRHKTRYRDGKLSTCLRLPDFAPYFEVVHMKDNLWVILQFHAFVPSPSTTANALLSELSSVGTAVANGSSQSQLGRLPTPQPATTASASSSADVQCPDPAKMQAVPKASGVKAKVQAATAPLQQASTAKQPPKGHSAVDAAAAVVSAGASSTSDKEVQVQLVTTEAMAAAALRHISKQAAIAVDCEGCSLSKSGLLCAVQVFAQPNFCYVFDLVGTQRAALLQQLRPVLEDPSVLKVFHDCRQDSAALKYQAGIRLQHVLDTQVAAGFVAVLKSAGGVPGVFLERMGLQRLMKQESLGSLDRKSDVQARMALTPDLWKQRPLPAELVQYASDDVTQLLTLAALLVQKLGSAGLTATMALSKAQMEWYFDPSDRTGAGAEGSTSYKAHAALPVNCPLEMMFGEGDDGSCTPHFTPLPLGHSEDADASARQQDPQQPDLEDPWLASMLPVLPGDVASAVSCCQQAPAADQAEDPAGKDRLQHPSIVEVVADLGRQWLVRFSSGPEVDLQIECTDLTPALAKLSQSSTSGESSSWVKSFLTSKESTSDSARSPFHRDNRAGIPGTLHRISVLLARDGCTPVGLTYRVGRHMSGIGMLLLDILARMSEQLATALADEDQLTPSLLILGPPGVGKTTLLRDVAGLLADRFKQRVIVVDTSCEIAGDGVLAHPCIGRARRMMVPARERQHEMLREAVQNHNPQVIVVDEIGSKTEVAAVKDIAQRGVATVGTAHGVSLKSLLKNPELNALVGGVHQVIVGDAAAKNTPLGQKTRTERKGAPCFSTLVEVLGYARWRVHLNVARSVDALLAGEQPVTQLREIQGSKMLMTIEKAEPPSLGVHGRQPSNGGASLALPAWMQQLQAYSK